VASFAFAVSVERSRTVPVTLAAHRAQRVVGGLAGFRDDLGDPVPVSEVDEGEAAQVAPAVDPPRERHLFPRGGRRELAAGVCPQHR